MKKIFLIFLLMISLVGCTEATTTVTYPYMSYLSFTKFQINEVDEQLNQEEDVYYIYFYGSNCSACTSIRNEALYTIEFLKETTVYFVVANTLEDIDDGISVAGTPSLVKVENGVATEVYTNVGEVLDALHGLS